VERFGTSAPVTVIHLGLDHELFAPMSKSAARRLLGIPEDKTIIAMGSVNVFNKWKGGPLFHGVYKALSERDDVAIILFGQGSESLTSLKSFGFVRDERLMPFIYGAADIFISTAIGESFGQSLLEASACARPVIALDVGGVRDIVDHEGSGMLVRRRSVEAF